MKQVANGFDYKVGTFDKYDINGYRFRTHGNEERRDVLKSRNTGVSAICNGVEYYGRLDEIYELHYFGANPPKVVVFKCHWFDPEKVRRRDDIGQVEIRQDNKLECEDVYIVAQQATQVFYLKYACQKKYLKGWDVVYDVPPHRKHPSPSEEDYQPHIDPDTYDGEFFQEEHGPRGRLNIHPRMEVHIDSEEEEVEEEEEEVTNVEDLSMLERLRLGIADEGDDDGQHEDNILDDTYDTDDEARTDLEEETDCDPDDPDYF